MAKTLTEWLGPFIASELESVIAWSKQTKSAPKIKKDPDSRFSDDGSNFRSTTASLETEPKVQLINVISSKGTAVVLVSDGKHSIKATLSNQALTTLEAGLEENLADDTENDVISLRTLTIRSTPYGPSDGRVQLHIEALQYEYHLRRKQGDPSPIEQHAEVDTLLEQIRQIRTQQYADAGAEADEAPASQGAVSQAEETATQAVHGRASNGAPTQPFQSQALPQSQARISKSQIPPKKKTGPSLAREGFEVETGINLAKPSGVGRKIPAKTAAQPRSTTSTALLTLLNGNSGAPQPATKQVSTPEQPPKRVLKDAESPRTNENKTSRRNDDNSSHKPLTVPSSGAAPVTPAKRKAGSQATRDADKIPYGRRRISDMQQRLLERKDSWYPSLPGHQFPKPNIPIELLKHWNTEAAINAVENAEAHALGGAEAEKPSPALSRPQTTPPSARRSQADATRAKDDVITLESDKSSSESSSDEELPGWSQSPTQRPKREVLPPDSTMESSGKSLRQPSPRQLPIRHSPIKAPAISTPNGVTSVPTGPKVVPKAVAASQLRFKRPFPPSSAFDGIPKGPRSTVSINSPAPSPVKQAQSSERAFNGVPTGPRAAAASPPQATSNRPPSSSSVGSGASLRGPAPSQSPIKHSPMKHKPPPPSSRFETVIRGTQYSVNGDDMEMDVPRPLDPAMLHRQRRSEALRPEQRRKWLQENCVYKYAKGEYVRSICAEYCAAHPNDQPSPEELYPIMQDVFPELDVSPQKGIKRKPTTPQRAPRVERKDLVRPLDGTDERSQADEHSADGPPEQTMGHLAALTLPKSTRPANAGANGNAFKIYKDDKRERSAHRMSQLSSGLMEDGLERGVSAFAKDVDRRPSSSRLQGRMLVPEGAPVRRSNDKDEGMQKPPHSGAQPPREGRRKREDDREDGRATRTKHASPSAPASVFDEYAHAWKTLTPGGAFAQQSGRQAPRRLAHRVNVLAWDV